MAQFIEHEIGNLNIDYLSPTLGAGRYVLSIHPVAKWVPDIWIKMTSWFLTQFVFIIVAVGIMLPRAVMVQECISPVRG